MYAAWEENCIVLDSLAELTYQQRYQALSGLRSGEPDFEKIRESMIKNAGESVYNRCKRLFYGQNEREKILSGLREREIACVTYFSEGYPEALKHIPCPPLVLYAKGNLGLLRERKIGVVGSRRTLPTALKRCGEICERLTDHFAVVSGLAEGADAAALHGALESGKAVSVLAYGFDFVYPAVNAALKERVMREGLLLSEYPPAVGPQKYHFPVRNRIIAGLCEAVLVVSAGEKSGALITADYALEYGRTVFAFPYTIGVPSGAGCNRLLKNGGILAENTLDIFSVYGLDLKPSEKIALSADEEALLSAIRAEEAAFLPAVAEKLGKAPYQLIPLISSLEIKGLVVRLGGNRYSAV